MSAPGHKTDAPDAGRKAPFPRSHRLLRHAEFERVYKQGKRHFASHMTVFYLARPEGGMRVGFTVSKALGGSVDRNRMRRRMREAVRLNWNTCSAAVDVVINPKKSLLSAEFAALNTDVKRALEMIQKQLAKQK